MRNPVTVAAATLCLSLSGCAGISQFNSALVPTLKPLDVSIHTDTTCGDLASMVMGMTQLDAVGALAVVRACEQRDASTRLTVDLQGARKALPGLMKPSLVPVP